MPALDPLHCGHGEKCKHRVSVHRSTNARLNCQGYRLGVIIIADFDRAQDSAGLKCNNIIIAGLQCELMVEVRLCEVLQLLQAYSIAYIALFVDHRAFPAGSSLLFDSFKPWFSI